MKVIVAFDNLNTAVIPEKNIRSIPGVRVDSILASTNIEFNTLGNLCYTMSKFLAMYENSIEDAIKHDAMNNITTKVLFIRTNLAQLINMILEGEPEGFKSSYISYAYKMLKMDGYRRPDHNIFCCIGDSDKDISDITYNFESEESNAIVLSGSHPNPAIRFTEFEYEFVKSIVEK